MMTVKLAAWRVATPSGNDVPPALAEGLLSEL
jgi:hypothetical protein